MRGALHLVALCVALLSLSCSEASPSNEVSGGAGMTSAGNKSSGGSSSTGGQSGLGGSAAPGDWADFAAAFCRAARSCCEADGIDAAGLQDCEVEAERQFDVLEGVQRGTVLVTEELASCVAQLTELADECAFDAETQRVCNAAFAGTVASAGECVNVLDCERSGDAIACIRTQTGGAAAASGTCRRLEPAALDEPCLVTLSERPYGITHSTNDASPPLTYCDTESELYCSSESGTCQSLGASGAPCTTSQGCQSGLVCVETCQEPKLPGAGCSVSSECLRPLRCIEGECRQARFASPQLCGGDLN
jgi:hypothetical protein